MQDDSIGKGNNDGKKEGFSLNKFDLMDDDLNQNLEQGSDQLDVFDAALEEAPFVLDDETSGKDKQEPSIPEWFDEVEEDTRLDDQHAEAVASNHVPSLDPSVASSLDHLDDDFTSASQSVEQSSRNRMIVLAFTISIVMVIAYFMMDASDEESAYQPAQAVLSEDIQMQRMEKKISTLQAGLLALQKKVSLQEGQTAALTHLLAEQSRKQQKMAVRQAVVKKVTTKKPVQKATTSVTIPLAKKKAIGWTIVIASLNTRSAAEKALVNLKGKGVAAEIAHILVNGKSWYRIRVGGFSSQQEAKLKKAYLAKHHGIRDAWIHKPK